MRLSSIATSVALIACLIGAYLALTNGPVFSFEQASSTLRSSTLFKLGKTMDPTTLALTATGAAVAIGLCFAAFRRNRQ